MGIEIGQEPDAFIVWVAGPEGFITSAPIEGHRLEYNSAVPSLTILANGEPVSNHLAISGVLCLLDGAVVALLLPTPNGLAPAWMAEAG